MIIIDTAFFLLELISGIVSSSLALTADAFHMVRLDHDQLVPALQRANHHI